MSYKPNESQDSGPVSYLPCRVCGKSTLVETLSNYGARCYACFDAYCANAGSRAGRVSRSAIGRIGQGGKGRAWAHALRERHQGGERLTKAQVDAYQSVCDLEAPIES